MALHLDAMRRLCAQAMANGATRLGPTLFEWDISGTCQFPVTRHMHARPDTRNRKYIVIGKGAETNPLGIIMHVRCKRCDRCLKARQIDWAHRAKRELQQAPRTWFCTLTCRPEVQHRALSNARRAMSKQGVDFDGLPLDEQFRLRHKYLAQPVGEPSRQKWAHEITLYLKRLRKAGAKIRFLMVAEAHKSGAPHYHLLIHETDVNDPVRYALLQKQWTLGFSQFKLVTETRQATYLCKYLGKTNAARVRASVGYGSRPDDIMS